MNKPILFTVDDNAETLALIQKELQNRYASDYEIMGESSPQDGLKTLVQLRESGREVAVLLADCWMPEMQGIDYLARAHDLHPDAKRGLLIDWGDPTAAQPILYAISVAIIDAFGSKPSTSPDEGFHEFITDFLRDWSREHRPQFEMVRIIGERWSRRCHELRDILGRNGIPFGFYDIHSEEGKSLLEGAGIKESNSPLAIFFDGRVLTDPTNTELASALAASTYFDIIGLPEADIVDTVIIGAGPSGLSAAVYGASEGLNTVVIEREAIGGQAGRSSRIRNYLGFPTGIPGGELAGRAYQQAWLFGADFTFTHEATEIHCDGNDRIITLSDGSEIRTRTVLLSMGVLYRKLGLPSIDSLIGAGVFYGAGASEAQAMKGQHVYVIGGGNSAGQASLHLAKYADQVTMLVRDESLEAHMSRYLIRQVEATRNIDVLLNTQVVDGIGDHRLQEIILEDMHTHDRQNIPASALFILIGARPHTTWLPDTIERDDEKGYVITGETLYLRDGFLQNWPLQRHPHPLETSIPGVFAAGDVRYQSIKRVASAVGEGSIAIQEIQQYLKEIKNI